MPGLPTTQPTVDTATAIELPDPLTPETVRALVARMSDDQVRSLLLDRLDAIANAQSQAASAEEHQSNIKRIQNVGLAVFGSGYDAVSKLPILFSVQGQAFANFKSQFDATTFRQMWIYTIVAVLLGFAAEVIVQFFSRRWQPEISADNSSLKASISYLTRRFMRDLLGLVVFYIAISVIGRRMLTADQLAFIGPMVFYLIWLPRFGAALSRLVISPQRPDLRLVNINTRWAKYLHRNTMGLFLLAGFTVFIVNFNAQNGVALGTTRIGFWLTAAVHIYVGVVCWRARDGLRQMMLGSDPDTTRFDQTVSHYYPYFAISVSFVMWLTVLIIVQLGDPSLLKLVATAPQYLTMFYLLMTPAIDTAIRGLVQHLVPPMIGSGPVAEDAYLSTKRSFIKVGRVIAGVGVLILVGNAWQVNLLDLARSTAGDTFGSNIIETLIVIAVGYMIYEIVSLYINRRLAREKTEAEGAIDTDAAGEGGGAGGSRLATVLPLVLVSAQVAITVVFTLLALSALGLDITPLLAGAGILGLAIGFGAQKLVSDVVSGVFFLVDDAFRTGEYVEIEGTMGTVEKISIRSMQLRHHRGLIHTIPYGEIPKLTNFSRDWVIMKLKFTVPFDTDPNKVKKIFKKIGAEMLEHPELGDGFIEPFKSQGVFDFDDVGMVIRGKFMAKPGTQFTIRKEIYNRVKAAFKDNGIEFARREVRVAIPGLDDAETLNKEQKTAISAAAAGLAQQSAIDEQKQAELGGAVKDDR
jgi:small-conductance mechanosensitive channel